MKLPLCLVRGLSVLVLICAAQTHAYAASITPVDDPVMGCRILVSGEIATGDAATLETLIEQLDASSDPFSPVGRRVCLDSAGGNMREGLAIARTIARGQQRDPWGTAVGPNARCESACALAFMAGAWFNPEGEYAGPDRILHPLGRLGFHRPELQVPDGQYSQSEVNRAFSVALEALGLIINMRAAGFYQFPESLLETMIETPSTEMRYIETVGEAARLSIIVAPSGIAEPDIDAIVRNICELVDMSLLDRSVSPFDNFSPVAISFTRDLGLQAAVTDGFRQEAASGCSVSIYGGAHPTSHIGHAYIGEHDPDRWSQVYAFHTHAPDTRLADLIRVPGRLEDLLDAAEQFAGGNPVLRSCFLQTQDARISNVSEYVNLRRRPDISAPILRQMPLGEQVRTLRADNITAVGEERNRQACITACRALVANPNDHPAGERAQLCIDNNLLWYEITDARGNRGWVSRKFLQEAQ